MDRNVNKAIVFLSSLAILFSQIAFAGCDPRSRPHGVEESSLTGTTPLFDVGIPSVASNIISAIVTLTDFQSPATSASTGQHIVAYTSLAVNGYPVLIATMMECLTSTPVDQIPMTDDERSEYRLRYIRGTYWVMGIDTALSLAMFLQATKTSTSWVTGLSIPVPLISAFFARNKFQRGPWRDEEKKGSANVYPVIYAGVDSGAGFNFQYRF